MRAALERHPRFAALYRVTRNDGRPMQDKGEVFNIIYSLGAAGRKHVTGIFPDAMAHPDDRGLLADEFLYVGDEGEGEALVKQVQAIRASDASQKPGLIQQLQDYIQAHAVDTPLDAIRTHYIGFWPGG